MFQVLGFVVGQGLRWHVITLRRRERQKGPKWQYYVSETHMHIDPLPTTIIYIDIIIVQQQQQQQQ